MRPEEHTPWHAWRRLTPTARWICVGVWMAALVSLGFGVWVESHGGWDSRPYLTNVFSSLTAALFGIPFAVVFLRWVMETQTDWHDPRTIARRVAELNVQLASAVEKLLKAPVEIEYLRELETDFDEMRDARKWVLRRKELAEKYEAWRPRWLQIAPDSGNAAAAIEEIKAVDSEYMSIKGLGGGVQGTRFSPVVEEALAKASNGLMMITNPEAINNISRMEKYPAEGDLIEQDDLQSANWALDFYLPICIALWPVLDEVRQTSFGAPSNHPGSQSPTGR